MAFSKTWFSKKVVSTDGYSVRMKNRASCIYEDEAGCVLVSVEMLATQGEWALFSDYIVQDGDQIKDQARRSMICQRVTDAFRFLGLTIIPY